jgi:hypothetical protein
MGKTDAVKVKEVWMGAERKEIPVQEGMEKMKTLEKREKKEIKAVARYRGWCLPHLVSCTV